MEDVKQQLVDKLKTANNILVTVSRNPSVDQLASCLALALLLNKQGKHTAAVFSGQIPSTIEFLQPEDTLEKNTDSLRDFIIALDKSKADKLRYKVEDNVVRIFITPYRTSITAKDLDFSQGDFNVDVVIALGVSRQEDLDEAITAHGRILHDATVASINLIAQEGLGSINWQDSKASSLSELVTGLAFSIDATLMDSQIANALLAGIVSATDRFRNDKTTPETMSASSKLMSAGANQQLVASKLEEGRSSNSGIASQDAMSSPAPASQTDDGTLSIEHVSTNPAAAQLPIKLPDPDKPENNQPAPALALAPAPEPAPVGPDEQDDMPLFLDTPRAIVPTNTSRIGLPDQDPNDNFAQSSRMMTEPPSLGGALTANSMPEGLDPVTDPLSMPEAEPPQLLERKPAQRTELTPPPANWAPPSTLLSQPVPNLPSPPPLLQVPPPMPSPPISPPELPMPGTSLSDIETATKAAEQRETGMDTARDEVSRALSASPDFPPPEPVQALNAQPLGDDILHPTLNELLSGERTEHTDTGPMLPLSQEITPTNDGAIQTPPPVPPPLPIQLNNPNLPQ